jgi:hypothetical protein
MENEKDEAVKDNVVSQETFNAVRKRKLSAKEILDVVDVKTVEVDVPEWNGSVTIRSLSAEEAIDFHERSKTDKSKAAIRLLVICIIGDDGKPLFSEADVDALRKKSLKAINRIQDAALELNGLNKKDAKAEAKND